jgi:hypothetical protein
MPRDESVDRRPELPPSASAVTPGFVPLGGGGFDRPCADAPEYGGPRNRLLTLSLIAAVCLTQAGWLGMLMWGLLWLFGTA